MISFEFYNKFDQIKDDFRLIREGLELKKQQKNDLEADSLDLSPEHHILSDLTHSVQERVSEASNSIINPV